MVAQKHNLQQKNNYKKEKIASPNKNHRQTPLIKYKFGNFINFEKRFFIVHRGCLLSRTSANNSLLPISPKKREKRNFKFSNKNHGLTPFEKTQILRRPKIDRSID